MSVRKREWGGETMWLVVDQDGQTVNSFAKKKDADAAAGPGRSVRKSVTGEVRTAWVVTYSDQSKKGHLKTFARKKDADAYWAQVQVAVKEGRHTPDSESITVKAAGEHWLRTGEVNSLERTTLEQYRVLLNKHIVPYLG